MSAGVRTAERAQLRRQGAENRHLSGRKTVGPLAQQGNVGTRAGGVPQNLAGELTPGRSVDRLTVPSTNQQLRSSLASRGGTSWAASRPRCQPGRQTARSRAGAEPPSRAPAVFGAAARLQDPLTDAWLDRDLLRGAVDTRRPSDRLRKPENMHKFSRFGDCISLVSALPRGSRNEHVGSAGDVRSAAMGDRSRQTMRFRAPTSSARGGAKTLPAAATAPFVSAPNRSGRAERLFRYGFHAFVPSRSHDSPGLGTSVAASFVEPAHRAQPGNEEAA
jgi:hypothetical protein